MDKKPSVPPNGESLLSRNTAKSACRRWKADHMSEKDGGKKKEKDKNKDKTKDKTSYIIFIFIVVTSTLFKIKI